MKLPELNRIMNAKAHGYDEVPEVADMVNHPNHYKVLGFEVIDILEAITPHYPKKIVGHVWNTLKYLLRAPFKGKLLEDMKKAKFYLDRAIKIVEE